MSATAVGALYRLEAPHFVAGLLLDAHGRVHEAAPILRWATGKTIAEIQRYTTRKGWRLEVVQTQVVKDV
jgi:hypothetical protein